MLFVLGTTAWVGYWCIPDETTMVLDRGIECDRHTVFCPDGIGCIVRTIAAHVFWSFRPQRCHSNIDRASSDLENMGGALTAWFEFCHLLPHSLCCRQSA